MFRDVRKGSTLHILNKSNIPQYFKGIVANVSDPYYPPFNPGQFNPMQQQYVNITVNVNGENQQYNQLPVNALISNNGNLIVACTQDAIVNEVKAMQASSREVVDNVEKHREIVQVCDDILNDLNPQFAQNKAQEEKINNMEKELSELKGLLGGGIDELKQLLLDHKNSKKSN